jgi:cobyrinic acid a,c-diamide synthase
MVGILPVETRMLSRRKSLGYVEVTLHQDSLWGACGDVFRGHEFHYSELTGAPAESDGWKKVYSIKYKRANDAVAEGYQKGNMLASYAHLHFASIPDAITHFLRKCER